MKIDQFCWFSQYIEKNHIFLTIQNNLNMGTN